eukprot:8455181-Karenia_brevis.AAC.1
MNHGGTMDLPTIIPSQSPYRSTGRMLVRMTTAMIFYPAVAIFPKICCPVLNRSYSGMETH